MGGKQKQSQRTKGNTKPSSSLRAAELLEASSSGAVLGFRAAGSLDPAFGSSASLYSEDGCEGGLDDTDFSLVLKRMTKKDATTKLKALQEFGRLCQEKDASIVNAVLPFWPKMFAKMSIDLDNQVRQATHDAFERLIARVGRNLARHLRSLMGPWLVAQCDSYPPAASAARAAFSAAFSPIKQSEAIAFCRAEVVSHVEDNLLKQTPLSLSDPRTTTEDERQDKYCRLLCSSLQAFNLFLTSLPSDRHQEMFDSYRSLLSNAKFWKFGKHVFGPVRAGFYDVLSALCPTSPSLASEFCEQMSCAVLYSFDESDPNVIVSLWKAVLHVIVALPNCWSAVNARKGVFPKLWNLLHEGGRGCAAATFHNLLPFLSKLPADVRGTGLGFYELFLGNIRASLSVDRVQLSPIECNAVVVALMECVRYCFSLHLSSQQSDVHVCEYLIAEQILPVFEMSLSERRQSLANSRLYVMVVDLLNYLYTVVNSDPSNSDRTSSAAIMYKQIASELSRVTLEKLHANDDIVLSRLCTFFVTFSERRTSASVERQVKSVRFESADESCAGKGEELVGTRSEEKSVLEEQVETKQDLTYGMVLLEDKDGLVWKLICESCYISLTKAHDLSQCHFKFISSVFGAYCCDLLISELLTRFSITASADDSLQLVFFRQLLLPWLSNWQSACNSSTSEASRHLLSMLLLTFTAIPDTEKCAAVSEAMAILSSRNAISVKLLYEIVSSSAQGPAMREWIHGAEFGQFAVDVAKELCRQRLQSSTVVDMINEDSWWKLLCTCLSVDEHSDLFVSSSYFDEILQVIKDSLPSSGDLECLNHKSVDSCVAFVCDFACHLFSTLTSHVMLQSAQPLLLELFHFDLRLRHSDHWSDIDDKVRCSWVLGLKAMLHDNELVLSDAEGCFCKMVACLQFEISHVVDSVNQLHQLAVVAATMWRAVVDTLRGDEKSDSCCDVVKVALLPRCRIPADLSWWIGSVLHRKIPFDSVLSGLSPVMSDDAVFSAILRLLSPAIFTARFFCLVWNLDTAGSDASKGVLSFVSGETSGGVVNECVVSKVDVDFIHDIARAVAFCQSCDDYRQRSSNAYNVITDDFGRLVRSLTRSDMVHVVESAFHESLSTGSVSSLMLKTVLEQANRDVICHVLPSDSQYYLPLTVSSVSTLAVILRYFSEDIMAQFAEIQLALLMSCSKDNIVASEEGAVNYLAVFNSILELQEQTSSMSIITDDILHGVLSLLKQWRNDNEHFLFDAVIDKNVTWPIIVFNIETATLLALAVSKFPTSLTSEEWDMIMCGAVAWLETVAGSSQDIIKSHLVLAFSTATFRLFHHIAVCIHNIVPQQSSSFPPNLTSEWHDLFSSAAYGVMLPLFVTLASSAENSYLVPDCVLRELGMALSFCSTEHVLNHQLPARLIADDMTNLPDMLQSLLCHLCPLLMNRQRIIQLTAYRLLTKVSSKLTPEVTSSSSLDDDKNEIGRLLPRALADVLECSGHFVSEAVCDHDIGDSYPVDPLSSEFSSVMAYLLAWNLVLQIFHTAPSEQRAEYARHLRRMELVDRLMDELFRLMPQSPVVSVSDTLLLLPQANKLSNTRNLLSEDPWLDVSDEKSGGEAELRHLACAVFIRALETVPALVRQWWTNLDKRSSDIVDRFTSKYASPILCARELAVVQSSDAVPGMIVKSRPVAREVMASYSVGDASMELVITLPPNHPLGPVTVSGDERRVGLQKTQWRNWMLQLTMFLTYQNGSMTDGLAVWKRNIDKHFEGVDDCMICFSVLHGTSYQLPRKECRTCHKRFHSECLYRWFDTSNNSACPLCRNLF